MNRWCGTHGLLDVGRVGLSIWVVAVLNQGHLLVHLRLGRRITHGTKDRLRIGGVKGGGSLR